MFHWSVKNCEIIWDFTILANYLTSFSVLWMLAEDRLLGQRQNLLFTSAVVARVLAFSHTSFLKPQFPQGNSKRASWCLHTQCGDMSLSGSVCVYLFLLGQRVCTFLFLINIATLSTLEIVPICIPPLIMKVPISHLTQMQQCHMYLSWYPFHYFGIIQHLSFLFLPLKLVFSKVPIKN